VFTKEELEDIADVVRANKRIVVITDEVYEWITYDGAKFARFCTLPGMWDRTLCISSAGKTFSVTGWKIGWIYGPENLVNAVARCHQFVCFSVATPLQEAIAVAFEQATEGNFFQELNEMYTRKRNFLMNVLSDAGLNPITPEGSFFILTDISKVNLKEGQGQSGSLTNMFMDRKDWNFCRWLTTDFGVAAIPCSAFYLTGTTEPVPTNVVRFAFCKSDEDLENARVRLAKLSLE
jgi:aspartate/methionine/tyrosine aminotransferase